MASPKGRIWGTELTVVGLRFSDLTKEGKELVARHTPFPVALEREPDNPVDPNAVKVLIAGDFKLTALRGKKLGHLRANIAAVLAPKFDAGTTTPHKVWCTEIDLDSNEGTLDAKFRDVSKVKKARK